MTSDQSNLFYDLETSLHKKGVRNSREQVDSLIADDFMEFGKSGGVYHKQDTLDGLDGKQFDLQVEVTEFSTRELSPDVVLVTYKATMIDNDDVSQVATNRSSIWVFRDNRWQISFHQGTKVGS